MHRLLREYVQQVLTEARANIHDAESRGLALFIGKLYQTLTIFVLYDPQATLASLKRDRTIGPDSIIAAIETSEPEPAWGACHDAKIVKASSARAGFGPLIYDIAMFFDGPIMSDRKTISQLAVNIWAKYWDRDDVTKLKLDDIDNPSNDDPSDDCKCWPEGGHPSVNYAFQADFDLDVSALRNNHQEFVSDVRLAFDVSDRAIAKTLAQAGRGFFTNRYRTVVLDGEVTSYSNPKARSQTSRDPGDWPDNSGATDGSE